MFVCGCLFSSEDSFRIYKEERQLFQLKSRALIYFKLKAFD